MPMDVSVGPFLRWYMVCPTMSMDVSVGRAFLTWMLDVFLPWSYISDGRAFLTWKLDVFLPWSDISVEEDEYLHGR